MQCQHFSCQILKKNDSQDIINSRSADLLKIPHFQRILREFKIGGRI